MKITPNDAIIAKHVIRHYQKNHGLGDDFDQNLKYFNKHLNRRYGKSWKSLVNAKD